MSAVNLMKHVHKLLLILSITFATKAQSESMGAICNVFEKEDKTVNHATILNVGADALLARIHLIRAAKTSIDIQTFIWSNDQAGRLLFYELLVAAHRGVKVRMIIDPLVSYKDPDVFAWLSSLSPNIEIKVYHPTSSEISASSSVIIKKAVSDFKELNQRMHNKTFTVDGFYSIAGGRNHSNAYYDASIGYNFKDRDVLVAGPAISEVMRYFELYWNYKGSIPIRNMKDVAEKFENGKQPKAPEWLDPAADVLFFSKEFRDASNCSATRQQLAPDERYYAVDWTEFWSDMPGKNDSQGIGGGSLITTKLIGLVSQAQKTLLIQTPYLAVSPEAQQFIKNIRSKHPDLRITVSTNSLKSNDSYMAYASTYKYKDVYLDELGFKIYEYKPVPGDIFEFMPSYVHLLNRAPTAEELSTHRISRDQVKKDPLPIDETFVESRMVSRTRPLLNNRYVDMSPYLTLHAKSLIMDDTIAFIGSYNWDPRSRNLNTEVAFVFKDKRLIEDLRKNIEADITAENSWTIAKTRPGIFRTVVGAVEGMSLMLPTPNISLFRSFSTFNLKDGFEPVDTDHPEFYERYEDVGLFPMYSELDAPVLKTLLLKSFGGAIEPII